MEPFLNRLNVILTVLLGALVAYQWSGENRADSQIIELRATGRKAEQRIAEQTEALKQANEDLDEFKSVISGLKTKVDAADAQIRQEKARGFTLEHDSARSTAEAAALKSSLAAFKDAVDSRDASIRTLLDERHKLAQAASDAAHKANEVVAQYNQLATQYQGLVTKYNDLARRQQKASEAAGTPKDRSQPSGDASS
jgi:chromosome segregation ATPase